MNTIIVSIGSNTFAKTNIDKAKRMLTFLFPDILFSDPILSEPEDDRYKYLFRNILGAFNTDLSQDEVVQKLKQTERGVGRTPRDKYQGKVVIDIDLLKYGDEIIKPDDFEKEYIQKLLPSLEIPEPVQKEEPKEESEASEKQDK